MDHHHHTKENQPSAMHATQFDSHDHVHKGEPADAMHGPQQGEKGGHNHHAMMIADFKRRFWVSLILTVPILILSPVIQGFFGLDWSFAADKYLSFALSTVLLVYGGKPFLTGAAGELKQKQPAMMSLIALAILVSYLYSALTVFIIDGRDFFWELATLIVVMLLGHWIEMRSVMGASKALEELAGLMPDTAHRVGDNGEISDVPVGALRAGDMVLIKPARRSPSTGSSPRDNPPSTRRWLQAKRFRWKNSPGTN